MQFRKMLSLSFAFSETESAIKLLFLNDIERCCKGLLRGCNNSQS
jgi:hypothetical protein